MRAHIFHCFGIDSITTAIKASALAHCTFFFPQYGRSDSYRVATTQDKDEKESPKKKGGKDLDDLKKEVPIVSALL